MSKENLPEIIGKMAISKDGSKLGRIIRIDEKPSQLAIISVPRFLQDELKIPIEVEFILTINEEVVKFDIQKKEFKDYKKAISKSKYIEGELIAKTEPARFLFFSNQRAENIPKQKRRKQ
ncbi:MAG: hypothetical protein FK732_06620 [Asgard group archaeon]|nr:hypothetical protein [Asgard group archaeon]